MTFAETLERVCGALQASHQVFIAAHIQPDGDCIGSMLALGLVLRGLGKSVTFSLDDHAPETFNYLQGWNEIAPRAPEGEDIFVYVDGSDRSRYGKAYDPARSGVHRIINIDHHATNEPFADLNLVDTRAASTAEIIYALIQELHAPLTPTVAQCLLTGIVTDTLGFRIAATTPETLEQATTLMRAGGSIPQIIEHVYNRRSFNSLRLLGRAINDARLEGPIIWSRVSQQTLRELGVSGNGTGGVVNTLLTVADAKVAFFLAEKEDGRIDLGLRARAGVDISNVALRLGGGGHKQAAGAMLSGSLDDAALHVLSEIRKELAINS
jgi:phosphoesterase RecJ-like protein